ncbi:hypothetical protein BS50DRAFT_127497 [Corynespora cassiicola Philippines]|uniref:Uncharacterized protein n=1 Tax=Corynespora cassiicola Philippines TaxID=1448308 RepID=A0A2T2NBD6_CORCC|nr:hypothetical protein BS50DRAFT_127497 [Corynespora cassiicola Philippines]
MWRLVSADAEAAAALPLCRRWAGRALVGGRGEGGYGSKPARPWLKAAVGGGERVGEITRDGAKTRCMGKTHSPSFSDVTVVCLSCCVPRSTLDCQRADAHPRDRSPAAGPSKNPGAEFGTTAGCQRGMDAGGRVCTGAGRRVMGSRLEAGLVLSEKVGTLGGRPTHVTPRNQAGVSGCTTSNAAPPTPKYDSLFFLGALVGTSPYVWRN